MAVRLNQLLASLNIQYIIQVGQVYERTIIERVTLMNSEPYIHLTTMNLGKLSDLKRNQDTNLMGIFLLIKDCEIDYSCFSEDKAIMIEVIDTGIDELKSTIEKILLYDGNSNDEMSKFISKMMLSTTLSGLLVSASNYFEIGLVVASPGGREIYAASEYDLIRQRAVQINYKSTPYTLETHAKSLNNNYGKDFDNNVPYALFVEDTHKWALRSKLYHRTKYLGYLVAYTDSFSKTSEISVKLFELLSEIVAHMIEITSEKNMSRRIEDKEYLELFLGDILEGEVDESNIAIVGNHELFSFESTKRVLGFPIKDYLYENRRKGWLIEKFREYFLYSIPFYYKRDVIILLNEKKDGKKLRDNFGVFCEFLRENHLKAFSSDVFEEVYQMPTYYRQVKKTEKLVAQLNKEGRIFFYDEFKFYDMALNSCNELKTDLKKYCNSLLLQLLDDDKVNHTDYYILLKTYITTNRSMTECANKLFIHKSTVAYRLNKIKEKYDLNFDNFNKVVELYNSFRLLELMGI